MFATNVVSLATNVVSLGCRPVNRRGVTGSRGRLVKAHGKKSGEIHDELKEKFTAQGVH